MQVEQVNIAQILSERTEGRYHRVPSPRGNSQRRFVGTIFSQGLHTSIHVHEVDDVGEGGYAYSVKMQTALGDDNAPIKSKGQTTLSLDRHGYLSDVEEVAEWINYYTSFLYGRDVAYIP